MSQPGSTDASPVDVSIVVPLYNEQENIPELFRRLRASLDGAGIDFELIFVDDGSRDDTARLLAEAHAADERVNVLTLSRNFGHQAAVSAGIDHARGQAVILMDGDLQDPPEVLPQFIEAWKQGNDVVYAIRTKRKEGLLKRICYAVFYRVLQRVSDLDIPLDSGDFCLMDRKVVDWLRRLPERNRFVRGLRTFVGFRQVGLKYERAARLAGEPKYTFRALARLAMDGLINFSSAPLNLVTYAGCMCLGMAFVGGVAAVVQAVREASVPGWGIATLAIVGCTGLQLLGMGILGEYILRIFLETKNRPTYIIGAMQLSRANSSYVRESSSTSKAA